MTDQERDLIRQIEDAFKDVVLGNGVGLREGQGLDDYADDATLAALRASDEQYEWAAISVADLDKCYSSLSFFDAEGMRFHLPAYLLADIRDQLCSADVLFHLTGVGQYGAEQFADLSAEQRRAVCEYMLLSLSNPEREFDHSRIASALKSYWDLPVQ